MPSANHRCQTQRTVYDNLSLALAVREKALSVSTDEDSRMRYGIRRWRNTCSEWKIFLIRYFEVAYSYKA